MTDSALPTRPILRYEALQHRYPTPDGKGRQVIDIEAWTMDAGQQVLLRGISGSGKTTLFNITAGLLPPTTGRVWLANQALYDLTEAARDRLRAAQIGYIFQNHHLLPALTAQENIIAPMSFAGLHPRSTWATRALELLAALGLANFAAYRPAQLSTGQRMRVAVARALANTPRLLLADEPTAALDAEAGQQVMDFIQATCREQQIALIVASHDPSLSARFAQHWALRGGQLAMMDAEALA